MFMYTFNQPAMQLTFFVFLFFTLHLFFFNTAYSIGIGNGVATRWLATCVGHIAHGSESAYIWAHGTNLIFEVYVLATSLSIY